MGAGGTRPKAGRPKKRKNVAIATVDAVQDLANTLKTFMDTGLAVLGHEVPELLALEIEQAKQSPMRKVSRKGTDGKQRDVEVYDKDIARMSQTSRHFLLKFMTEMMGGQDVSERSKAAEALRELIQIQTTGDVIIGKATVERGSSVLTGQAGSAGQRGEGATGARAPAVIAGTTRSIS